MITVKLFIILSLTSLIAVSQIKTSIIQVSNSIDTSPAVEYLSATAKLAAKNANYDLATTVFNAQYSLGEFCSRCKSLKYYAFRVGTSYLTAFLTGLKLIVSTTSEPTDAQLFQGIQNIDGTWAFRSKTENKYIKAQSDGVTINYQTYIGPWERWWIERHYGSAHLHIQSAQFYHYYWVFPGGVLQQSQGAQGVILQYWPQLKWGWN